MPWWLIAIIVVGGVVAFVGGCEASGRIDKHATYFERVETICAKNDGLESADSRTATCVDGARFSISDGA